MRVPPKLFSRILLRRSSWFIALFQAALIFLSLVVAWLLRFDFSLPYSGLLFSVAPILILLRLAALGAFGLFHGWWKYTGISDVFDILKGIGAGSAAFIVTMRLFLGLRSFPRSVYVLEALLTVSLLVGVRFFSRAFFDSVQQDAHSSKRIAIIGAGTAAQMILRELRQPGSHCIAVACVDDDPSKKGLKIQDVPVMGAIADLPSIIAKHPVNEILIAIPSATASQMQRFVRICETTGTKFRTAPSLRELIAGEVSVGWVRDVNVEDLLGRDPVRLDLRSIGARIQNKSVLVTGAAGSIGSELCRQILACRPKRLVCADRSETGVFYLHRELERLSGPTQARFCITDVSNAEEMLLFCRSERPEVIFHAAALKHGPLLETNAREAVKNNIFGLTGLLDAAERNGCQSFVFISSDKSVNSANIMGATKRVGELILSSRPSNAMRCISVRFGNVLNSNGSVVPIFNEQIRSGHELTITHPDVCRFFMTIHEAVSLVLQAFTMGSHGEILVLDMGQPVRILDLATTLIRLSGKSAEDVRIRFTGLRPGEKLCEELFHANELVTPTCHPKIRTTRGPRNSWAALEVQLKKLRQCVATGDDAALRSTLQSIVSTASQRDTVFPSARSEEASEPELLRRVAGA